MSNYFLVLCAFLYLSEKRQGNKCTLTKIVFIEILATFTIKIILKDFNLYTYDNMAFIVLARNLPIFIAIKTIFKHRKSYTCIIMLLLYVSAFVYNALTFDQLFRIGETGVFMSHYPIFMRVIMMIMVGCLFINVFGRGIKNHLGSRLYFINRGNNYTNTASSNLFARINRFWFKP